MKQRMVTWGLALTLVLIQGAWFEASAAPRQSVKARTPTRSVARTVPSVRSSVRKPPSISRSAGTRSVRGAQPGRVSSGRSLGTSASPLGQALGAALSGRGGGSGSGYRGTNGFGQGYNGNALSELGQYFDRAQRESHYRSREDREYKSYRDAMIANTVVQVVGMITSAQPQRRVYAPAQPVHEVRRVVVQEGHYERYRVYIEPVYDSRTGKKIDGGYHETRTRWVPPRYEERLVLVER